MRNNDWDSAMIWHSKIDDFSIRGNTFETISDIFTGLYILEALLVYIVGKLDRRNIQVTASAYNQVDVLMKALEKETEAIKVIAPR